MTAPHTFPSPALARLHARLPGNLQRALAESRRLHKDGLPASVQRALAGQAATRPCALLRPVGASGDHATLSAAARAALRREYERWLRAALGLEHVDLARVRPDFGGDAFRLRQRESGQLYQFRPQGDLAELGAPTEEIGGEAGRWLCDCFRFYLSLGQDVPAETPPAPLAPPALPIGNAPGAESALLQRPQARPAAPDAGRTDARDAQAALRGEWRIEVVEQEPRTVEEPFWPLEPLPKVRDDDAAAEPGWSMPTTETPPLLDAPGAAPDRTPSRHAVPRLTPRASGYGRYRPRRSVFAVRASVWARRIVRMCWRRPLMRLIQVWRIVWVWRFDESGQAVQVAAWLQQRGRRR